MTDGYKIKRILVGTQQVYPAETVQTFDFKNNGALNWTGENNYGVPYYDSGQGWTIGSSQSTSYQSVILPPNSVYDNKTLKKYKIWMYKLNYSSSYTTGAGMSGSGFNKTSFWRMGLTSNVVARTNIGGGDNDKTTQDFTGEVTLEYDINDDGNLYLSINGNKYTLGAFASAFRTAWTNKNLGLLIGRWGCPNGYIYIRKVEITTK